MKKIGKKREQDYCNHNSTEEDHESTKEQELQQELLDE
jgi:hypothetical protein